MSDIAVNDKKLLEEVAEYLVQPPDNEWFGVEPVKLLTQEIGQHGGVIR